MAFELRGTFQDRLVSELRFEGISSPEEANRYLYSVFLPKYNRKFTRKPKVEETAYRAIPQGMNLDRILCIKEERRVQGDNIISYKGRLYQILPTIIINTGYRFCQIYFSGGVDMYDFHFSYDYAKARHEELLKEAEIERLIRKHRVKSPRSFNVLYLILSNLGKIMVNWGSFLQKRYAGIPYTQCTQSGCKN